MLTNRQAGKAVDNERGAVAILVAASLVMLMGFAAITVDGGAAFSERRQDQSAADMASMVAVQFARGDSDPEDAADLGAEQAVAIANANLDNPPTSADWSNCVDPNRPGEYTVVSSQSRCISFTDNLQKARVVIPTIEVATTFARVLGAESIATSAFAEAQGDLGQPGRVLPFGFFGGGPEICLKTAPGQGPPTGPCEDSASGNFGTLLFSLYGNRTLGTKERCGSAATQDKLDVNMAVGVDHPLGTWSASSPEIRDDTAYCPLFNSRPNQVDGQAGSGANLYNGMVDGVSKPSLLDRSYSGRLARGSNRIVVESGSPAIDDTPLWAFLDGSGNPAACSGVTDQAGMRSCLSAWNDGYGPLFRIDIDSAPRFGAVPRLNGPGFEEGKSNPYLILDLIPVYVQATWWGCGPPTGCKIVHVPGDSGPDAHDPCPGWQEESCGLGQTVKGSKPLDYLTAFVLDRDMLPEPLRSDFPGSPGQVDYALVK